MNVALHGRHALPNQGGRHIELALSTAKNVDECPLSHEPLSRRQSDAAAAARDSGEPFPDGIEIYALPDALEPLDEADLDTDLWALLRWIIEGTGGEWWVEDLDATGRLYQLAAAGMG